MRQELTRKYGLLTAICFVVGTVIGSGIFFRNDIVFAIIGGDVWIGVAAWLVSGLIALSFAYVFGVLTTRYEDSTGLPYFVEKFLGARFGYMMAWFMATIMVPGLTAVLAWVSARFTVVLVGWDVDPSFSAQTYLFALFYLVAIYVMNALSPKLAEKFHVSCTFIKIIPLILMGVIGLIVGLSNGTTVANLNATYVPTVDGNPFLVSLIATAFAYLGWEVALSLNKEIINAKRNLPIALVAGMLIIIVIYLTYFIGLFSAAPTAQLASGAGVLAAFINLFTETGGTILFVFIIISCLGTLNGLVTATGRMFYTLAISKKGPKQKLLSQVDDVTTMPANSMALGLLFIAVHTLIFAGHLHDLYNFDISGLIPITFKAFLIPMLIAMMIKEKQFGIFNRFIAPSLAVAGACFQIYAVIYSERMAALWFLIFFAIVMTVGLLLEGKNSKD